VILEIVKGFRKMKNKFNSYSGKIIKGLIVTIVGLLSACAQLPPSVSDGTNISASDNEQQPVKKMKVIPQGTV
jgi:hypothetical protein